VYHARTLTAALLATPACSLVNSFAELPREGPPGAGGMAAPAVSGVGGETAASGGSGGAVTSGGGTASTSGPDLPCPRGMGPPMIDLGEYCIDATEVTRSQYLAFLQSGATPFSVPAAMGCSFNATFTPSTEWEPMTTPMWGQRPVVGVDWCDAHAYCQWAGKRLCGKIGGGPSSFAFPGDETGQWYRACSNGVGTRYPYGERYDATRCVGADYNGVTGADEGDASHSPGTAEGCHGVGSPFDLIYDLSGNVTEWEDACNAASGQGDKCLRRGGDFKSVASGELQCKDNSWSTRETATDAIGFRCCSG
jgi:formylglycine-generating enzyme required for sulfatase activity